MTSKGIGDDTSVRVALRIRPQSAAELIGMCRVCTSCTSGHPQVILGKDKAFTFDYVFDVPVKQPEVYVNCVKELVEGCLDGYNATVLAYGQTGSGKTYTMGTGFDVNINSEEEGIVPRAVGHLFDGIERRKQEAKQRNEPQPDFKITVQFMELYHEDLIDLFDTEGRGRKSHHVKIHEDSNGIIYTMGVTTKSVKCALDTLNCLQQGALCRTTASTNMNTYSSRSHAIFTILIKQQRVVKISGDEPNSKGTNNYEYEMLSAKFNFVDLAGSERLKRTGATGDRAKEGISINCGLLALGNVISALGDVNKKGSHVPYRDSKLTRLLQDSLGGNSCTLMIACVSPSDRDFMETLNTLKYANRARNIKNKVVVNQDKASKQINLLRTEIQKLTSELVDFRQGSRVSSCDGESDASLENNLLRNENDKLRVRIKGLQSTVEVQSSRITDLMSAQVLATLDGIEVDGGVESLIQKYLREIEELRNKLIESEAMAIAITRHATLKSRLASPMHIEGSSVLEMAKMDLAKQKQKAQNLKSKSADQIKDQESSEEMSGDEEDEDNEDDDENDDDNTEEQEDGEQGSSDDDDDDDDDDSTDEKDDEEGEKIEEELVQLTTDIEIKQKLIDELEVTQHKLQAMKSQYEGKLVLLTNKIRETEVERDHVLKNIKQHDTESSRQASKLKDEFEKKLSNLKTELKKVQLAQRNHAQLLREKAQNDLKLRQYSNELTDMKKTKARLMKQMKEEIAKNKQKETMRNKEIAQLKKVSRIREITIKNLQSEKRQKDLILKRKQEELKALRRQQKPVSGPLGAKKNQLIVQPVNGNEPQAENDRFAVAPSGYGTYGYRGNTRSERPGGPPRTRIPGKSPRKKMTIEQATKMARKKWDLIERKVGSLVMHKQTIANLEKDYDRWVENRNQLSKDIEKTLIKMQQMATEGKDDNAKQELKEQMEALTAHMEYVQDNIDSCQACIMQMEDPGNAILELSELVASTTLQESRILLDHYLIHGITQAQELSAKEAAVKELEGRLEATKQHNYLQQELLHHVLQQKDVPSGSLENLANGEIETLSSMNEVLRASTGSLHSVGDDLSSASAGALMDNQSKSKDKARRRTGCPEDFLYPDRAKTRRSPSLPSLSTETDSRPSLPLVPTGATEFKPTKQISPELMQKLLELEKKRKNNSNDNTAVTTLQEENIDNVKVNSGVDSKAMNTTGAGYTSLPVSLMRGNLRSKSARSYPASKFSSMPAITQPRSQPTSPALPRKASTEKKTEFGSDESNTQKITEDVFSRLTSSLGQDSDPDVGRMLPLRPPTGKPAPLVCTYAATGHNSAVLSLDVTEDFMFTGSKDKTVKVWDLNTGEEIISLSGHKRDVVAVRYSRSNNSLFSVSQNLIKVWDIRQDSGKCIKTLTPQAASSISGFISGITADTQINDLKIGEGGTHLYAAMGNTVRIWDLKTYSMTGKLGGHAGPVMTVMVKEREQDTLVFTGSRDHFVKIFELGEGSAGVQTAKYKLEPPHYDGVQCIGLRGSMLFSGSRDNSIKKWDYNTHQLQQHVTGAHKAWVCALDFLPKRNVLLSGCRGGFMKLWDADTCQPICEVKAHRHPINAIATNSSCVFTASSDRLVRLWRVTGTLDEQLEDIQRAVQV